jgi:DDE superfamily endonuclease
MYGADSTSNTREVALWIFYKPYLPKWGIWQTPAEVFVDAAAHDFAGMWHSDLCEKTYRRQYSQSFAFIEFNQQMIVAAIAAPTQSVAAIDCSFVPKSGKATYGVDWFYNGSANRSEKGLEISVIAVIDVAAHRGYTLSVQQTPPTPVSVAQRKKGNGNDNDKQTVSRQDLEQIAEFLKQLPEKSNATQPPEQTAAPSIARIDHYLAHLQATHSYFPVGLKYLVGDGFYSKQKWVNGVVALDLHLISKLRVNADLRYLYTGSQKPKGRHRQYDGKVELDELSRFTGVDMLEPDLKLYTAEVWHVSLKRKIRLALLVDTRNPDKPGYVLLFSTDVNQYSTIILDGKAGDTSKTSSIRLSQHLLNRSRRGLLDLR